MLLHTQEHLSLEIWKINVFRSIYSRCVVFSSSSAPLPISDTNVTSAKATNARATRCTILSARMRWFATNHEFENRRVMCVCRAAAPKVTSTCRSTVRRASRALDIRSATQHHLRAHISSNAVPVTTAIMALSRNWRRRRSALRMWTPIRWSSSALFLAACWLWSRLHRLSLWWCERDIISGCRTRDCSKMMRSLPPRTCWSEVMLAGIRLWGWDFDDSLEF